MKSWLDKVMSSRTDSKSTYRDVLDTAAKRRLSPGAFSRRQSYQDKMLETSEPPPVIDRGEYTLPEGTLISDLSPREQLNVGMPMRNITGKRTKKAKARQRRDALWSRVKDIGSNRR